MDENRYGLREGSEDLIGITEFVIVGQRKKQNLVYAIALRKKMRLNFLPASKMQYRNGLQG
jgi:choline kinase